MRDATPGVVNLDLSLPVWDEFFTIAPLILVGSRDPVGTANIAPKHMGLQMGWENYYGFVCSPNHRTQQNIIRHGSFTVSFTRPNQIIVTNLAASPRWDDDTKPGLQAIPTRPATTVDGVLVENCYLWLECELERTIDGLGPNSLVLGKIVAASAATELIESLALEAKEQGVQYLLHLWKEAGALQALREDLAADFEGEDPLLPEPSHEAEETRRRLLAAADTLGVRKRLVDHDEDYVRLYQTEVNESFKHLGLVEPYQ